MDRAMDEDVRALIVPRRGQPYGFHGEALEGQAMQRAVEVAEKFRRKRLRLSDADASRAENFLELFQPLRGAA